MDTQATRTALEQLLRELDSTSETLEAEGAGETSELSHVTQHPGDVGTEVADNDREVAVLEADDERRAEVQAALDRLDAGTYGRCIDCGQEIDAGPPGVPARGGPVPRRPGEARGRERLTGCATARRPAQGRRALATRCSAGVLAGRPLELQLADGEPLQRPAPGGLAERALHGRGGQDRARAHPLDLEPGVGAAARPAPPARSSG